MPIPVRIFSQHLRIPEVVQTTHESCAVTAVGWKAVRSKVDSRYHSIFASTPPAKTSSAAATATATAAPRLGCAPEFDHSDGPIDHLQAYSFPDGSVIPTSQFESENESLGW